MKNIIAILKNIFRPKYRFIYKKRNGEQGMYVITNPTAFKGSLKTTFSNPLSRRLGNYNIGFLAKTWKQGNWEVRSFYWDKVRDLQKLSIFEQLKA